MARPTVMIVAILAISCCCLAQANSSEFERYMQMSRNADSRDMQVEYLQKALKERPDSPENIFIEFKIATEWGQSIDASKGEGTHPRKALVFYQSILDNYDYMHYYEPRHGDTFYKGQNLMVQAAIQAGCIYVFELNDKEKGRKYQHLAMKMLKQTFDKRRADWEAEEKPTPPTISKEGMRMLGTRGERMIEEYKDRLKEWQERRKLASQGEVFGRHESGNARISVKHFGLSYGRRAPELVPLAMHQITKEFPGTPMAKIAQGHIDRALKMVDKRQSGSALNGTDISSSRAVVRG
jgi:hypothetical protein